MNENIKKPKFLFSQNIFCTIILVALCAFMPLYLGHGLYDVVEIKYAFTVICAVVVIPHIFLTFIKLLKSNSSKSLFKKFDAADCLFFFLAICSINIIFSQYKKTALFGLPERYNGLVLLVSCVLIYCAARFVCCETDLFSIVNIFIFFAALQSLILVINWFWGDPFLVLEDSLFKRIHIFLGTMGNVNFTAAYICLAFPVALYMYLKTDEMSSRIFYLIMAGLTLFGILICGSDGAFIAVCAVICVIICSKDFGFFKATALSLFGMGFFLLCAIFGIARSLFPSRGEILSVFGKITGTLPSLVLTIVFLVLCLVFNKFKSRGFHLYKLCRIIVISVCSLAVLAIIIFTFVSPNAPLPAWLSFFRINARWGSSRGYVWDRLIYLFGTEQNLFQMLFGSGLESVNFLINPHYTEYIIAMNGVTFDSAHNDYLQYLMCTGVVGVSFWIAFLAMHIKKAFKARKSTPISGALALGLLCYSVQAIFNVSMPIYFVFVFLIAGISARNFVIDAKEKLLSLRGVIALGVSGVSVFFLSFIINNIAIMLKNLTR